MGKQTVIRKIEIKIDPMSNLQETQRNLSDDTWE